MQIFNLKSWKTIQLFFVEMKKKKFDLYSFRYLRKQTLHFIGVSSLIGRVVYYLWFRFKPQSSIIVTQSTPLACHNYTICFEWQF